MIFWQNLPGSVCHNNSVLNHRISIMIFTMIRVLIMALFNHFIEKFIVKFWISYEHKDGTNNLEQVCQPGGDVFYWSQPGGGGGGGGGVSTEDNQSKTSVPTWGNVVYWSQPGGIYLYYIYSLYLAHSHKVQLNKQGHKSQFRKLHFSFNRW